MFYGVFLKPVELGSDRMFWEKLLDTLHVPAFAGAALFIHWMLPRAWTSARRSFVAFAIAFVVGVSVEYLQELTGRQASFDDALYSVAGAFLGALGIAMWPRGRWSRLIFTLYAAVVCAGIFLPAWRRFGAIAWRETQFPVLADFEETAEFRLWYEDIAWDNPHGVSMTSSTFGASHGLRAARIVSNTSEGHSVIRLYLAKKDWREYRTLAFDVFNPGSEFVLSLRLDDRKDVPHAEDRFYRAFPIVPGWNHLSIPIEEIARNAQGRPLRIESMYRIVLFLEKPRLGQTYYLDWIRLE